MSDSHKHLRHLVRNVLLKECGERSDVSLMDPLFNIREICKEFTLLEDHLNCEDKRCFDCINKHFLKCEALAEEAISLDDADEYPFLSSLPGKIRSWHYLVQDGESPGSIASGIRRMRKDLMPVSYHPSRRLNNHTCGR